MKSILNRIVGALLILAALGGLAFSAAGLTGVWRYQTAVTENLASNLELIRATLNTTAEGLIITQESLQGAVASISASQDTLNTTIKTIQSTEPMVEAVVNLLDKDIPQTLHATQASLNAAQESARVIDGFLKALNFLPGVDYDPEKPLNEALGDVSDNLADLPKSLAQMADSLGDTQDNLQTIQVDLALMAESIQQAEASLEQYEKVIESYQESVETVQTRLEKAQAGLPQAVQYVAWGLTAFLAWMAIAQLGLFIQGWELLSHVSPQRDQETTKDE